MRLLLIPALLIGIAFAQSPLSSPARVDVVRVNEFYRLNTQLGNRIWPRLGDAPDPLLLVTNNEEFLTRHPSPPNGFTKIDDEFYARPRQFPTSLLATFPAFGPPSVIVIGEPENTDAKTSTPWLFTVMHEHFHQLQDSQPGLFAATESLGLAHGDRTGMWMLNYPFPYDKPEIARSFAHLRDLLLTALTESDPQLFARKAELYKEARRAFVAQLSPDDVKYFSFQLWKEGIARYVQVKSAEAAAHYQPTTEFAALPDYEPFDKFAAHARADTIAELRRADLPSWKRTVVYPFGACEGFLLDRINPNWRDSYFNNLFTLDPYFR